MNNLYLIYDLIFNVCLDIKYKYEKNYENSNKKFKIFKTEQPI